MGNFKRPTGTWKVTERAAAALFGGERVPLSGSNSGHGTSADVRKVPSWLYIEVKRKLAHNHFWHPILCYLQQGLVIRTSWEGFTIYLFRVDTFMKVRGMHIEADLNMSFRENSVVLGQYLDTYKQAQREGRDATILIYRIHGKHGLYAVAEDFTVRRLEEWIRKEGRPMLKPQPPKPKTRKIHTRKPSPLPKDAGLYVMGKSQYPEYQPES